MHIGAVLIFDGPPPAFEDYLDHVRGRLHLVPRYRQRLSTPPLESGRPLWTDDPSFNLEYHVRHSALPAPGTEEQLFQLTSRIVSQQLDRSKPLWESWLIEGLEDDRFALIFKTHHALVDGVSGVDLGDRPVRPPADAGTPRDRPRAMAAEGRALAGGAHSGWRPRRDRHHRRARPEGGQRRDPPRNVVADRPRRGRGPRRDRVGGSQPGAGDAAQRRHRPSPAICRRPPAARGLQGSQGRARRHRQRCRADRRVRVTRELAALTRDPHRRPRDARARAGFGAHRGRARDARQPPDRDARTASGVHPRPGRSTAVRQTGDGRPQGVKAGGGSCNARRGQQSRAADDPRPGLPAELLDPAVQPHRHQHSRAAAAALRARPGAP